MEYRKIKECVEYLKNNCDEFIARVWVEMLDRKWIWDISGEERIPNQQEIKYNFFKLLDDLTETTSGSDCGGFHIMVNNKLNRIECDFGKNLFGKNNISFFSKNIVSDETLNFIDRLCDEYPIINKEWLREKYLDYKQTNDCTSN